MRERKMNSLLTISMSGTDRAMIEHEAGARGVSLSAVVRDFMAEGMKAKGLIA
jgi:hypothetical protein